MILTFYLFYYYFKFTLFFYIYIFFGYIIKLVYVDFVLLLD